MSFLDLLKKTVKTPTRSVELLVIFADGNGKIIKDLLQKYKNQSTSKGHLASRRNKNEGRDLELSMETSVRYKTRERMPLNLKHEQMPRQKCSVKIKIIWN